MLKMTPNKKKKTAFFLSDFLKFNNSKNGTINNMEYSLIIRGEKTFSDQKKLIKTNK